MLVPITASTWGDESGGAMPMTWTDEERTALNLMRQRGAYLSDDDLIRGALFWYARFLDLDLPQDDVFALARPAPKRRRPR